MRIAILTNEFPPHVYGGAGVHVEHLVAELRRAEGGAHTVEVVCFGGQREAEDNLRVLGVAADRSGPPSGRPLLDPRHAKVLETLSRDVAMTAELLAFGPEVIHCHTWYVALAGCLSRAFCRAPLALTAHSLEPYRAWKRDQLGTGYDVSSWLERTAFASCDGAVAVSRTTGEDIRALYGLPPEKVEVIHNGIDLTLFACSRDREALAAYRIDPDKPYVLFVGRISEQKGILHLLAAARQFRPDVQLVLAATSPDTPELRERLAREVAALSAERGGVVWIEEMVPRERLVCLYSGAALFICPSVYEPFGIINLEAMACGTPVVASAVGGIPEVVVPGETGFLVDVAPAGPENFDPADPEAFARRLADAANRILDDPELGARLGAAARKRVEEHFAWPAVAARTIAFYRRLRDRRAGVG